MSYRAKIDAVHPMSRRQTFTAGDRCFLGVSLQNSNFATAKLAAMLEWIARRFSRCTVLVGDSIHRITLEVSQGLAPPVALQRALALGRSFTRDTKTVFQRYGEATDFSFLTCNEVQKWPSYAEHHAHLRALAATNEEFRTSVERFGRRYHDKHTPALSKSEREHRVRRSSDYFLEEFAIFACLQQQGIPVMVYPGSFSTLAEIADGDYREAPQPLQDLTVVALKLKGRGKTRGP